MIETQPWAPSVLLFLGQPSTELLEEPSSGEYHLLDPNGCPKDYRTTFCRLTAQPLSGGARTDEYPRDPPDGAIVSYLIANSAEGLIFVYND